MLAFLQNHMAMRLMTQSSGVTNERVTGIRRPSRRGDSAVELITDNYEKSILFRLAMILHFKKMFWVTLNNTLWSNRQWMSHSPCPLASGFPWNVKIMESPLPWSIGGRGMFQKCHAIFLTDFVASGKSCWYRIILIVRYFCVQWEWC